MNTTVTFLAEEMLWQKKIHLVVGMNPLICCGEQFLKKSIGWRILERYYKGKALALHANELNVSPNTAYGDALSTFWSDR